MPKNSIRMSPRALIRYSIAIALGCTSLTAKASFIESSMGAAVVNDATATYFNPAALSLLNNLQILTLDSYSSFQSKFTGQATLRAIDFSQSGITRGSSHFFLPTLYVATPMQRNFYAGLALIINNFDRDIEGHSPLRYMQSNNEVKALDIVPAIAYKLNDAIAIGLGLTLSRARFESEPITGIPSLNIPDSQSRNHSSGASWGGDVGLLIKPSQKTVIGLNYRMPITYQLTGSSTIYTNPSLSTNDYKFKYWIPARSVLSVNHFVTQQLGFIGTAQYIQWGIFQYGHIYNIATRVGAQPVILPSATVPYHFRNAWLLTLGTHYRATPSWIIRIAGSFIQSPSSGQYQIDNGNTLIVGASSGYEIYKNILIDGSYAYAFVQDKRIHIENRLNTITGLNQSSGNAISLKLTVNVK